MTAHRAGSARARWSLPTLPAWVHGLMIGFLFGTAMFDAELFDADGRLVVQRQVDAVGTCASGEVLMCWTARLPSWRIATLGL